MADKISTERQLALWLGNTMLQVNLTFVATQSRTCADVAASGVTTRNTPADHIRKFYKAFSDIRHQKFDGFVVTGVNALSPRVKRETFWPGSPPESCNGRRHTPSRVSSCAGARRRR